jgi:hypothetical protein
MIGFQESRYLLQYLAIDGDERVPQFADDPGVILLLSFQLLQQLAAELSRGMEDICHERTNASKQH